MEGLSMALFWNEYAMLGAEARNTRFDRLVDLCHNPKHKYHPESASRKGDTRQLLLCSTVHHVFA